jgi:hypothetical protein
MGKNGVPSREKYLNPMKYIIKRSANKNVLILLAGAVLQRLGDNG